MRLHGHQLLLSASDLSAYLRCQHRTQLDRRAAARQLEALLPDPMLTVLQVRDLVYERAYVGYLDWQ